MVRGVQTRRRDGMIPTWRSKLSLVEIVDTAPWSVGESKAARRRRWTPPLQNKWINKAAVKKSGVLNNLVSNDHQVKERPAPFCYVAWKESKKDLGEADWFQNDSVSDSGC